MKAFNQYWSFSAIRGVMTLLAAVAIFGVPWFSTAILPISLPLGLAIDCLAAYCMLDAGALFLMSLTLGKSGLAHRVQAAIGVAAGGGLFVMTHGEFASYLMLLVAVFAASAAVAEFAVARKTNETYHCLSCYARAAALIVGAIALPFATVLGVADQITALAAFVGAYGAVQVAVASRMLFLEYRAEHPAAHLSNAWQAEMNQPLPVDSFPRFGSMRGGYLVPGRARVVPRHNHHSQAA